MDQRLVSRQSLTNEALNPQVETPIERFRDVIQCPSTPLLSLHRETGKENTHRGVIRNSATGGDGGDVKSLIDGSGPLLASRLIRVRARAGPPVRPQALGQGKFPSPA